MSEKIGKSSFWVMVIGFNLTFGPMHILGLQGMSRRIQTYSSGQGFDLWNLVATIGAFMIAIATAMFIWNVISSRKAFKAGKTQAPGPDPWDARSLEWMTASPVPEHNFDETIHVEKQDEFWHRKWGKNEEGQVVRRATAEEVAHDGSNTNVHLPSPSYWPLVAAAGLPIIGYGLIYSLWLCVLGGLFVLGGLYGWVFEPVDDPNADDHHDDHEDESHAELESAEVTSSGEETTIE